MSVFLHRDEDMKTLVEFTLKFKKKESGALRHLQSAISSDYLASMPVYKDTLLRDGKIYTITACRLLLRLACKNARGNLKLRIP